MTGTAGGQGATGNQPRGQPRGQHGTQHRVTPRVTPLQVSLATNSARTLQEPSDVVRAFFTSVSGITISAAILMLAIGRVVVGSFGVADLIALTLIVIAIPFVEWAMHKIALHRPPSATSSGHLRHHQVPDDLDWVMLSGQSAVFFLVFAGGFGALVAAPGALATGSPAALLTGVLCAWLAVWNYEWTHLIIHTSFRTRLRYYLRRRSLHRLHHWRNENYWFGVTTSVGDRVFGTLPSHKGDVDLSDTARDLS